MSKTRKGTIAAASILLLVGWIAFMYIVGPRTIVNYIGVNNTYLAIFFLGVFGGVSSPTAAVFYSAFAGAITGGANPIILVLVGAPGLIISDTAFYLLARHGHKLIRSKRAERWLAWLKGWLGRQGKKRVQTAIFAYVGLTPLPNDILMIALALTGYPYRLLAAPLIIGDFVSLVFFSILTVAGINLL